MNRLLSLSLAVAILLISAAPVRADTTYVVRQGDTLFAISLRFGTSVQALMQANGLTNPDRIFVGQVLRIPTGSGSTGAASSPAVGSSGSTASRCGGTYTIQRGDTLRIIAQKCGTSISAIASLNGIANADLIFAGQVLRVPASPSGSTGISGAAPAPLATQAPPPVTPTNVAGGTSRCPVLYTIQRGDTLRIIAEKCGVTAQAILANNAIPNPNLIFPGQVLSIPGGAGAGSVPSSIPAPTTPPAAATLAPPQSPVSTTRGLAGQLTLCNPEKPSFAADIERICFRELITNTTGAPVSYGVLGVQATNLTGGPNQFHTSWRGDLVVPAGGQGPVGGGWEDGLYIDVPGTYRLQLSVCFSSVDGCFAGIGWEVVTSGVDVKVVDWHP